MDRVTLISDLQSAQATYDGAEAEYNYQEKLYERNKTLHSKQLISDTEYEQYEYNYRRAKSTYDQSKAALAKAQRNLSYTIITSPINIRATTPKNMAASKKRFLFISTLFATNQNSSL